MEPTSRHVRSFCLPFRNGKGEDGILVPVRMLVSRVDGGREHDEWQQGIAQGGSGWKESSYLQ